MQAQGGHRAETTLSRKRAWQSEVSASKKCLEYDAFGSLLPGRNFNSGSYRFGFQGQESDGEINGERNSYAFEYRIHDPRVGRFLSIDPLVGKYPFWTPYAFSGNRVIDAFEFEGLEPVVKSFTHGSSPAPYWFISDERTPQKFSIEDGDERVGGFDFAGDAGGTSLALVRGNDCCQRPDPSDGTASHDVNYLLDARIIIRYQSVPVLSLLKAAMNQNPDLKLAIVGNHRIPRDPMLKAGQLLYSRDQLDAQPSLGNDFTKLRADFVRSDFFGDFNNVDTYSRNDVEYGNNPNARWSLFPRSIAMPGLGDDARGITMLFDFRGVQNTPRGAQPDATPVAPDTRYRNVRHL